MLYVLIFLLVIRLAYYILIFSKLATHMGSFDWSDEGVSILICTKDNEDGLRKILPRLLKQNYSNYEIIIIDDFSKIPISSLVQEFNDDRIKIIKASQDINGKKQAVEDGVDAAKFNWILQTDSDCMPASLDWIKWMIASRKKDTELVLGFSPAKSNSSFIGNIAAYETFYIGIQYLSYCLKRMPYMGVGRNILYNKQAFLRSQPYHDNKHIASGDDDFIVQKIANNLNTEICIEPNSFTYTVAPSTISEYVSQKNRHVTTSIMYTSKHKLLLGIFSAVHILFYFLIIWSLVLQLMSIKKIAGFYLLMTSVMWIIKLPIAVKLKQVSNLLWFHIADLFLSLFYILIALKIMQKREIKWK